MIKRWSHAMRVLWSVTCPREIHEIPFSHKKKLLSLPKITKLLKYFDSQTESVPHEWLHFFQAASTAQQ